MDEKAKTQERKETPATATAAPGKASNEEAAKEGKAKISVYDKDGKLVREFDGPGKAGVNRTNWDLRWNSPAVPTPEQVEAAAAGFDFGPRGPLVEPGEYTIKIKAGSKEESQKVVVEDDPRMQISAADRAARSEAIQQLYALAKTADKDRKTIEGIKEGLKGGRESNGKRMPTSRMRQRFLQRYKKPPRNCRKKWTRSRRSTCASAKDWEMQGRRLNGSPSRCRSRCKVC